MKYMLMIYAEETALEPGEREACYQESTALAHDLQAGGHFLGASPLHPTTMATTVRVRGGRSIVTGGPFAETREQLGGFFLIEATDRDQAIRIAGRIPACRWGTVEIRPIVELAGLPADSMSQR